MKNRYPLQQKYITLLVEEKIKLDDFDSSKCFFIVDNYFRDKHLLNKRNQYSIDINFKDHDNIYWLKATEKNKTFITVNKIIDKIFKVSNGHFSRDMTIVGIGGGICLDISAFCASLINRGSKLTLIPTTLLALCDAGIGGKTGVNFKNLKNKIGTFYPANKIIYDYRFLSTLSLKKLRDGYAELLKTMLIFDRDFFLSSSNFQMDLPEYIFKCAGYKLSLCMSDLNDSSHRQVLNLGHSFGHLLESLSDYKVSHGQAVYLGILLSLKYSYLLKKLSFNNYQKYHNYFFSICGKFVFKYADESFHQKVKNLLLSDKKTSSDTLTFILVTDEAIEKIHLNKDNDREQINDLIDFIYDNLSLAETIVGVPD